VSAADREQLEEVAAAAWAAARGQAVAGTPYDEFLPRAVSKMVAAVVDAQHYLRPQVAEVVGTPSEVDGITIVAGPPGNPHTMVTVHYPMRMSDDQLKLLIQAARAAAQHH
jgi:hypothetical protein